MEGGIIEDTGFYLKVSISREEEENIDDGRGKRKRKEEEEALIQRFCELEIQEDAQEVQEAPPSQCLLKSPPKKQSKITSFFK